MICCAKQSGVSLASMSKRRLMLRLLSGGRQLSKNVILYHTHWKTAQMPWKVNGHKGHHYTLWCMVWLRGCGFSTHPGLVASNLEQVANLMYTVSGKKRGQ